MDFWVALIGLVGITVTAVSAHWPRLKWDVRAHERIMRDLKLLQALPPGAAYGELAQHIDAAVSNLIKERNRKWRDAIWRWTSGSLLVAFVLLFSSELMPADGTISILLKPYLTMAAGVAMLFSFVLTLGALTKVACKKIRMVRHRESTQEQGEGH